MSDFTRRTVVRGTAWTVPVIAVASQAPAFAVSPPPYVPPNVDFANACATTGSGKRCGIDKALFVPVILSNPGTEDILFQVTAMYTINGGTIPNQNTPGVYSGLTGIYTTACARSSVAEPSCPGGAAGGTIVVPAGANNQTFYIVSRELIAASEFSARIEYRLLSLDCTVLLATAAERAAIPSGNCK